MYKHDLTLTDFLRHSGRVLEDLEDADTVLRRRDGDDLVLTTVPRMDALTGAGRLLAETMRQVLQDREGRSALVEGLGAAAAWTERLGEVERGVFLQELAEAVETAADLGEPSIVVEVLERWRARARERPARTRADVRPGWETRPVAIPDDVDDPSVEKASGVVELPLHVRWSGPRRAYDLDDPRQLRRVYEQVLREGVEEDVRRFIDVDVLLSHWDDLVLPPWVRRAWADRLVELRGVRVAC